MPQPEPVPEPVASAVSAAAPVDVTAAGPSVGPAGRQARVAVVVLTGGRSSRMGRHKPGILVDGRAMVARVLDAVRPIAAPAGVVVVGEPAAVAPGVPVVSEDPPGGGPVAGVAAGLAALATRSPVPAETDTNADATANSNADVEADSDADSGADSDAVLVLAADLPLLTTSYLSRLVERRSVGGIDCAVAVDIEGRRNWLCSAWDRAALATALEALGTQAWGASMRRLAEGVSVAELSDPDGVTADVDTPQDLAAVLARRRSGSGR